MTFARAMLVVFLPFACGYFFSYLFRTINAVVAPHLRADIGLGAAELGFLTSAYFLTFAAAQIPLGMLLDRFGPRRVQAVLYSVAALGAVLFALGDNAATLTLGRALIGAGVSGGLMAALKAIVLWFPRKRIALVNGWYLASGGLGAIGSTVPVEFLLGIVDWRTLFLGLGVCTFAMACLIFVAVPEKPGTASGGTFRVQMRALGAIYRDRYFWRIVPLMFTCSSSNMAVQGLWAGPWLADVSGYDSAGVARHLLLMAVALTVGMASSGAVAGLMQRLGLSLSGTIGLGAALFVLSQVAIVLEITDKTYLLWCAYGFLSTLTSLVFAALAQHFPETHIGRANTAANVMVFSAAFSYQAGLGAIIGLWPSDADGAYPAAAYAAAFWTTITTQSLALAWYLSPWSKRK